MKPIHERIIVVFVLDSKQQPTQTCLAYHLRSISHRRCSTTPEKNFEYIRTYIHTYIHRPLSLPQTPRSNMIRLNGIFTFTVSCPADGGSHRRTIGCFLASGFFSTTLAGRLLPRQKVRAWGIKIKAVQVSFRRSTLVHRGNTFRIRFSLAVP